MKSSARPVPRPSTRLAPARSCTTAGTPGRDRAPGTGYAATAVAESCVASLTDGRRTGVTLVDRPPLYP
ncbi:MAG: hypothetical protein AUI10_13445 [Actinobacteria bacterium 13_2_20CM_2_72_6]|nr:MAG: hypothetical protein AUI10_13445 [Actinobacteria bacterium 13_2_20CM_2_72_6]